MSSTRGCRFRDDIVREMKKRLGESDGIVTGFLSLFIVRRDSSENYMCVLNFKKNLAKKKPA